MSVAELYNSLSPAKRREIDLLLLKDKMENIWIPLVNPDDPDTPTPQQQAYYSQADILLFGGSAGGGKAVRSSEKVLTPFGWTKISDLSVGKKVCSTDGAVQEVIGHYPQGVRPMYRLKWHDGSETICDENHIWLMWKSGKSRKIGNARTFGEDSARKWTTKQIYDYYTTQLPKQKRKIKLRIPVISAPCAFNVHGENNGPSQHISRVIPAYVLGVILGDGCISGKTVSFCSADPYIPERVDILLRSAFGEDVAMTKSLKADKASVENCYIPKALLWQNLEDLGLVGCVSNNKFIPRIYLFGSSEERWELLAGLMDTDGWCDEDGDCYFTTVSRQLAEDVRHLARSLGAIVFWREGDPTYTHKGELLTGQHAYTLRIKMRDNSKMFRLPRKKERCAGREYQSMGVMLESIEPCGEEDAVCIEVSHPNSLYIIEDFIVTHNSGLGIGLALTAHKRSLILRREAKQVLPIADEIIRIRGTREGYNGQNRAFNLDDTGQFIQLGGMQYLHDREAYQGVPYDLQVWDELTQFMEEQFRYLMAWNRSSDPDQRCRVLCTSNPPQTAEGQWVIKFWGPWLDPHHPNPALPGELRWFTTDPDGNDMEVDGPQPIEVGGDIVHPRSRSFIPSSVDDNPFLIATGYKSQLQALPEPLRSQMLKGDFTAGSEDNAWQVIPKAWVEAAMDRWREGPPNKTRMSAMGVDPARGGRDKTIIARRYGNWYDKLIALPGSETIEGSQVAAICIQHVKNGAPVFIDIIGGAGTAPYEHLKSNGVNVHAVDGRASSSSRERAGRYGFVNKRSEMWWRFREALDPDNGENVQLPYDREMMADLCAPRWSLTSSGLKVEGKGTEASDMKGQPTGIKKRLGRSPDKGDAVVYAWNEAPSREKVANRPKQANRSYNPHRWR